MDKPDESGDKKQIVNMNEAGGTTLLPNVKSTCIDAVSYTHLRAHET